MPTFWPGTIIRSLQIISRTLQRDIYSLDAPGFPIKRVEKRDPDPLAVAGYSCVHWIYHLRDYDPSRKIKALQEGGLVEDFLCRHYLHWHEALSLLRSTSEGITAMLKLEALLQVSLHPVSLLQVNYYASQEPY